MALTDTFIKNAKHSGKPVGDKHSDGGGLYLHIKAAGKYWRMAYRFAGKQKTLALGVYPAVTLAQARKARDDAKATIAQGLDPSTAKRAAKVAARSAAANTFEALAREFHATQAEGWSPDHAARWLRRMEKDLFPYIGHLAPASITAPVLLDVLRRVEGRGTVETAHILRQSAGQVFRYGIQTGRCERSPVPDLQGALKPVMVTHMAAVLEPVKVGELMRAIDGYTGQPITRAALQLSALLFQRPGNIRAMEWAWIDFDNAMLAIPPAHMKRSVHDKVNGKPHLIPLAQQAVGILRALQPLTGYARYVFPGARSNKRPMSDGTINAALRRLDFGNDAHVGHGFRAMARTMIAERMTGIPDALVEAQLGHGKSGPLGSAYDRAEYLDQRRLMMQTWADYLDKLRQGAEVIPLRA